MLQKKACLATLNRGIFLAKTRFYKKSILAHNSFIYYISKMFYYTPNVHRVSLLITLIVYTNNRYKILHSFTRKMSFCHLSFFKWFRCLKKKKKYIIYWLSITYILTFIFLLPIYRKMTNDKWLFANNNL